jgi:hypothetical protein
LNITAMRTQSSQLLINHLSSSFDEWGLFPLFFDDATPARAEYIRSAASVFPQVGCLNAG